MDARLIPEDLMVEIRELYERLGHALSKAETINERHQDNEYREWNRDYERSIAC
jgi:hypothetical protein